MAGLARTSSGKRRRLSAEERRERIVLGAIGVFAERGYQGASISEIARAAGITPAVIYDHFASKAELHNTLLERETHEMLGSIAAALEGVPEDPERRLRVGVDAFLRFVEEHRFAWRMIFRDPPTDPEVAAAYGRMGGRATQAMELFLRTSAPPAMLDDDYAAEVFTQMLISGLTGLAFWWYDHRDVPRELLVDRVLDFCWTGLERMAVGARARPADRSG